MFKSLILAQLLLATPIISMAQQTENRDSCVIQVLKNNTNNQTAHFVLQCGAEVIASHNTTPMEQQTPDEVTELKAGYLQALKNIMNTTEPLNCTETDTELFWIGICTK